MPEEDILWFFFGDILSFGHIIVPIFEQNTTWESLPDLALLSIK